MKHKLQSLAVLIDADNVRLDTLTPILDTMDLLHSRRFDGFCLVSSDSDFTRLATRIREDGLMVFGFGEKQTPRAFANACDCFNHMEELTTSPLEVIATRAAQAETPAAASAPTAPATPPATPPAALRPLPQAAAALRDAYHANQNR